MVQRFEHGIPSAPKIAPSMVNDLARGLAPGEAIAGSNQGGLRASSQAAA
jgi:hypothetical protein